MKILHVLASNRFSGAENVVCQIIEMFKDVGNVEMAYCSLDGPIRGTLESANINFFGINKLSKKEIQKVITEYKPDIIHAHDMRASFIAGLACKKIPLISHIHNNAFDSRGLSIKSVAYLFSAIKAKHIFWVSDSAFKGYYFHKLFSKKSSVIYNVIDCKALYEKMELDKNKYDYDVIYLGRLTYPKNPERMINVLSIVKKYKNDVKIAIVGTGELEDNVKKLSNELNLDKNIDFFGFQNNPLKILWDSKVMIMTSRWEGTPMCALEAIALNVPIVSTPTDGLKDLVKDDKIGYLSDDDNDLAEKILEITNKNIKKDLEEVKSIKQEENIKNIFNYKDIMLKEYKKYK